MDYRALTNSLVFNDVTRSQTVTVTIQDDNVVEQRFENFFLDLSSGSSTNITIEDDDSKLTPQC